jgi:tetratricopeptide (TPR) repeat protein
MAWYELALIYQHNKYDYVKAKECFDKAVALLRDDDIKKKAIGFSKSLALLDTLRQGRAKKDTTADSLLSPKLKWYKIGEMFWFDLQEPDSAYRRFMLLTKDTSLPEEMYPKTLYAAGWIALNALKDTVTADSLFDLLIDGYPDNAYSKRAQIDRGREVTIQTEEDLAWDAFKGAEQMYLDREQDSVPAAVEAYLSVYKDYPECEAAPKSLYAAAWICDNMLAKNKTAKGLYEKLCAEYPQTEYCMQSAKPRLKVAMDTLTALRERSKQKSQENKDSRPVKPGENTKMQQRKNTKTPTSPPDSLTPVSSEDLTAAAPASKDTLVLKDTSVLKGAPALKDTSTTHSPAGPQELRKK